MGIDALDGRERTMMGREEKFGAGVVGRKGESGWRVGEEERMESPGHFAAQSKPWVGRRRVQDASGEGRGSGGVRMSGRESKGGCRGGRAGARVRRGCGRPSRSTREGGRRLRR